MLGAKVTKETYLFMFYPEIHDGCFKINTEQISGLAGDKSLHHAFITFLSVQPRSYLIRTEPLLYTKFKADSCKI